MIFTIDVGNTRTKASLIDKNLNIIAYKNWRTPDLFEPDRWKAFFDELYEVHPLFSIGELRISCVSWRAFLALRVFLDYDTLSEFDTNKEFNPDLLILPLESPFVLETYVPIDMKYTSGLIGTDRLLAAYAGHRLMDSSVIIVSLGTATVIDLITNIGVFFGGIVMPGLDVSYSGLLDRATSLPPISDLKESHSVINDTTLEGLYAGLFLAHSMVIESAVSRITQELNLETPPEVVITGGRTFSMSSYIGFEHFLIENLVSYGLALIPTWTTGIDMIDSFDKDMIKKVPRRSLTQTIKED